MKDPNNKPPNDHDPIFYEYDALSRLKQMTQPTQPLSTHHRLWLWTQDNLTSITDPKWQHHPYFNDDFRRNNQTGSPDTGTTDHLYDEAGNLTQSLMRKGQW